MKVTTTNQSIVYLHQNGNLSFQKHKHLQINQPILQYPFHGPVKRSATLPILFLLTGYGVQKLILIKICKLENPLQLPQFTMAMIRGITKKNLLLTQSPERNANTKIKLGRYYSSPSCTSSGYSGDTYCKDCNETISYGYTISAYGHDYDNGVITTEPTAETDGIITYTCKRCKHQDTKTLGNLVTGNLILREVSRRKAGMLSMI